MEMLQTRIFLCGGGGGEAIAGSRPGCSSICEEPRKTMGELPWSRTMCAKQGQFHVPLAHYLLPSDDSQLFRATTQSSQRFIPLHLGQSQDVLVILKAIKISVLPAGPMVIEATIPTFNVLWHLCLLGAHCIWGFRASSLPLCKETGGGGGAHRSQRLGRLYLYGTLTCLWGWCGERQGSFLQ